MKVSDLMTRDVITLNAQSPLISAEEVMGLRRVRHLPCVDNGKFVGLVTHRDLLRAYHHSMDGVQRAIAASKIKVGEIMHTDVQSVPADTELTVAARLLREHKWGCLPVVDGFGRLVGIVTDADFLRMAEVVLETLAQEDPATLQKIRARLEATPA
jgi:CBS-domain-containing membrane protein